MIAPVERSGYKLKHLLLSTMMPQRVFPSASVSKRLASSFSNESLLVCRHSAATNTINSYMLAMDKGASEEFAKLWVEGGTCEIVKMGKIFTGHSELRDLCTTLSNRFVGSMHFEANHTLQSLPDGTVANESYWQAITDGQIISMGIHTDVLEVDPHNSQNWLFRSRKIYHTWSKDGGREHADAGCWAGVEPQWK